MQLTDFNDEIFDALNVLLFKGDPKRKIGPDDVLRVTITNEEWELVRYVGKLNPLSVDPLTGRQRCGVLELCDRELPPMREDQSIAEFLRGRIVWKLNGNTKHLFKWGQNGA